MYPVWSHHGDGGGGGRKTSLVSVSAPQGEDGGSSPETSETLPLVLRHHSADSPQYRDDDDPVSAVFCCILILFANQTLLPDMSCTTCLWSSLKPLHRPLSCYKSQVMLQCCRGAGVQVSCSPHAALETIDQERIYNFSLHSHQLTKYFRKKYQNKNSTYSSQLKSNLPLTKWNKSRNVEILWVQQTRTDHILSPVLVGESAHSVVLSEPEVNFSLKLIF